MESIVSVPDHCLFIYFERACFDSMKLDAAFFLGLCLVL